MINKKANVLLFAWPYNGLLISFTDSHQDFMQIVRDNSTCLVSSYDDKQKKKLNQNCRNSFV
jgi:hypothetical protein